MEALGVLLFSGILLYLVILVSAPSITFYTMIKIDERRLSRGIARKCPHCAEIIRFEARVCRFCGREVMPPKSMQVALDGLLAAVDSEELTESAQEYYERGLALYRLKRYHHAANEFAKAVHQASPESRWSQSAQAKLRQIYRFQLRGWW